MSTTNLATPKTDAGKTEASIDLLYRRSGSPMPDRAETIRALEAMTQPTNAGAPRAPLSNVFGEGLMLLSDIPDSSKKEGVVLGIDEAGRGSVLGPMVYGAAYWNACEAQHIPKDFNDSKQLTEDKRASLLNKILHASPQIGFAARVLHASEISRNMLRTHPYNLNQMSHDSAIGLIRQILNAGVKIDTCYIDTVGNPEYYKKLLQSEFPTLDFVVESKADAKYAPCSAASVVAKVLRDGLIENWKFSEPLLSETSNAFGSGYPSDPVCKKWMEDNLQCKTFGFPDIVRFSWGPAKKTLEENGVTVAFEADEAEEEGTEDFVVRKRQQEQMNIFLGKSCRKRKRFPVFERRGLEAVERL